MEKKKFIRAITKKENGRLLAIASTENKDRVGDSLKAVDWDLKHFLNNPVLQAGHDYRPQYTIGIAENIKVVDNQLTFTPKFHNITQLATEIAKMYDEGYLTAWSVGFIPKEQNIETQKNQLLEISAVAVPANPYALTSVAKSFERELVDADKNEFIIREIKNWLRKDINITITNSDNESEIKDPGASEPAVTAPVNQPENADGVTLQVRTGQSNGHTHIATINSKTGDGITNNVNSHFHLVKNFKVQMGGSPTEQHDHTLEIDPSKISKELKDLGVNKIWDESDMMCSYEVRPVADFEDGSLETKVYQEEPKIMAMMGKLMGEETMEMQSLVFMKTDGWTLESAQAWVEEHSAELKGGPGSGKPSGYGGGGTREASSSAATVSSGETVGDLRDAGLIHDSSQFDGQSGSGLESDFLSGDEYVEISSGNGFDGVYESGDDAGISDLGRDGVTDLVSLNEDGSLSFHNISKVDGNKVTTTDMITGESNGTYEIASDDGGTISGDTTAPDGSTVVFSPMYRATEPDKKNLSKAVSVETGMTNEHTHIATVNAEGDGKTNEVLGHTHEIVDWGVLEAGDPPHTHTLEKPAELTDQTPSESPADATPSEMPTEGQGMKGLPVSLNKAIGKKKTRWNISLSKVFDIENNPSVTSEAVFKLYCNYLECKVKDMFIQMESIPSTMLGNVLHAYKMVLGKYQLRDTRAYGWKGDEMPPVSEVIQLNSKEQDDFLVYGSQFYDNKGTGLIVEVSPDWMGVRMRFISNSKDKEWVKSVVNEAKKYAKENNKLKGEMFALSGEFLSKTEDRFNDLILDENTKRAVMNVSSQINKKGAEFKSRGMILLGPPGTGKTKTCRAFMNETNASLIWVSSKDLDRIGATRGLSLAFSVAREIAPAVILFEDIDGWIKGYGTDLLKTELDGLKQQNAVLTVLTSNHPEELPDALIDRPGRFHDVLEFDLPTKDLRSEMLIKWLGDSMSEIDETKFNTIIAETEGMSGAHLKELVDFARVLSEEEQVAIDDAVIKSLVKLKKQRELIQTVKEKQFGAILKEGRVISTKNAAVINNAITAQKNSIEVLEKLLEEAQPTADTSADTQKGFSKNGSSVKGRAELHKLKEQKSNRQITSDDIALRVLKQIAGQSSLALSKLNK